MIVLMILYDENEQGIDFINGAQVRKKPMKSVKEKGMFIVQWWRTCFSYQKTVKARELVTLEEKFI